MTDEERKEFGRLVKALDAAGTLEKTDIRLVELAAVTYIGWIKAKADVDKDGRTLKMPWGAVMPHPMLAVMNTATIRLKAILNDLGLTPAAAGLTNPKRDATEEDDPWSRALGIVG